MLLNIAMWCAKYNNDVRCLDRTKRPAVLYVTQENDNEETVQRKISYVNGLNDDGSVKGIDELRELFEKEKLINSKWAIIIKYRPKNSITTTDLESMVNEVEADGDYEVKMLIHDYIKRIGPENPTGDMRIDLGEANLITSSIGDGRVKLL
ncbi:DnaB family ATPase [Proteus mirabilis]|uniref:DnaB family ATPase n=1 Tax=Proteus mirabilis TaxID=584 RepID=UPI0034D615C8